MPGPLYGQKVQDIDDVNVKALYEEARRCYGSNGFTAAVLCCRKLLMHIAVAKKAAPGLRFIEYVQYLVDHHYVPPDAKEWVDHIRSTSNEANHEIVVSTKEQAAELIDLVGVLLKVIFEFPKMMRAKKP
ncbi:MAG: DUF4145 domain-containing protein [Deltaproteobacteria bacterium]|nr:DUF4145 domain-containing protein [Deltaproteobacteria bacterium]